MGDPIRVYVAPGEWRGRTGGGSSPGTTDPPPDTSESLFAGHVPNRVLLGMSTPSDSSIYKPGYTEATQIIGQTVYAHREFTPNRPSGNVNWLPNTLEWNRTRGLYPACTFKFPDWAAVRDGGYDSSDWALVRQVAAASRTSGPGGTPQPFAVGFNHEPRGDGDLTVWGQAQTRMSNYFAGWTTNANGTKGTYTAANDYSDIMAWTAIFNGFWMGPNNVIQSEIDQALPPILTETFRENRSLLMGDFYDPLPRNKDNVTDPNRYLQPYDYSTNADRASMKCQAFVNWARARNCGAIGCGEFSATEGSELAAAWQVIRDNRDIWGFASLFNSVSGASQWYWPAVPEDYPPRNPDVYKDGVLVMRDFGGFPESAAKLAAFQAALTESVSPTYTSPV